VTTTDDRTLDPAPIDHCKTWRYRVRGVKRGLTLRTPRAGDAHPGRAPEHLRAAQAETGEDGLLTGARLQLDRPRV